MKSKSNKAEMLRLAKTFQLIWLLTFGLRVFINILEDFFDVANPIVETSIIIPVIGIGFGLAGLILQKKANK
ncbi:MAG: hypothetical protein HN981_04355 [Candidatus Pacebacteria bacterium]|jgi:hypothetical protein|nr:hypothetical protein [Candidatus Paceibacterota bacterium]MBT4652478.1 hypothetical protein [Candidatus Paceibacterota bacterium]MBT6756305.1 hypothetical protein [Candidatus Paceibacterota bacterium]MBT6921596.1 hypothetical protein [Candidatus Paceibacterota bacterium]